MDWSELYPEFFAPPTSNQSHDDPKEKREKKAGIQVEFADIGCGYGGLLGNILSLSPGLRKVIPRFGHLSRSDQGPDWPFPLWNRHRCCDISIESLCSGSMAFALEKGGHCLQGLVELDLFCLVPLLTLLDLPGVGSVSRSA